MKISTKIVLKDLKGETIKENDREVTLGEVVGIGLAHSNSSDKYRSYKLSKEFFEKDEVEITPADMVFIKKVLEGSTYTPIVVGQCIDIIEGK